MAKPVFIVSTGRCGSTMMSNIVRGHPHLLSLSEFFTSLSSQAFRGGRLSGAELFRRLNTLSPAGRAVLKSGLRMEEFLYQLGPGARYRPEEVPPILCATLPHLSREPELLWDELAAAVRQREKLPLAEQYRFVFEWLMRRFEKRTWVERSGGSLLFVPVLARLFPDARFVHIFRDGRDTAMSMFRHPFFRLRVQAWKTLGRVGVDDFAPFNLPGTSPWAPWLEWLKFRKFDAEDFRKTEIDLAEFGSFWSAMILRGDRYLQALPAGRTLSMRYESIVAAPENEIRRFLEFADPAAIDEEWLAEATKIPRYKKPAWLDLDLATRERLDESCRLGNELLESVQSVPQ